MPELDGKATHKDFVTPFDAHEQVVRQPHTFAPVQDSSVEAHEEAGYKADLYEHQEYPKAVAHDDNGEPVLANDAAHEAELAEKAEE